MELVKKNVVSIICGAIILIAIAAIFWPINGYYASLRGELEKSVGTYNSLHGLATKERHKPVISLDKTEPERLDGFPNDAAITEAKGLVDKVKAQSQAMFDKAVKLNTHGLLVDGALPEGSPFKWNSFRNEYIKRTAVNPDLAKAKTESPKSLQAIVEGATPPGDQEIQAERTKKEAEIKATAIPGPNGQAMNQVQIDNALLTELPKVADDMKNAVAMKCKVYFDPAPAVPFDPSPIMMNANQGGMPGQPGGVDPSSIFNAQVGYWIQEDICNSIAAANKEAKNVTESPVKHLVKMEVLHEPFKVMAPGAGAPETAPPAPNADPSGAITKSFITTPTGRTTNGVYDVIPFNLRIVVDAAQIPRVLQELSRSKFVTVTGVQMSTVDSAEKHAEGYFYGDSPVVVLDLRGEALLLRKWTEPLMPLQVKRALGLAPAAAPQGQAQ
ncbi:MAG TPA: hypothetical protein VH518_19485 [Tepidisphaeraceae bacterium]|jgi:hypothetical protein